MVDVDDTAGVQQAAELLVEGDPAGEFGAFALARAGQVPFDAEVAEERGAGPEGEVVGAAGGVGAGGADVGADEFGRQEQTGPAVDGLAFQGVVAVAGPDAVGALQDGEVDPSAAAGAGFDLQVRVACAQFVEQGIDGESLAVDGGFAAR
ncbi:hypothetical protein TUSST3_39680 [Streptomyces sp. TUS-ST3]|nr:hypothetical protein TUSST3_39680 [Streptomyces sp. TUS-ST3]